MVHNVAASSNHYTKAAIQYVGKEVKVMTCTWGITLNSEPLKLQIYADLLLLTIPVGPALLCEGRSRVGWGHMGVVSFCCTCNRHCHQCREEEEGMGVEKGAGGAGGGGGGVQSIMQKRWAR